MDEFTRKRLLRQKRIRKRRLFIGFVCFLILLLVVAVILALTVFFPIQEIRSTGSAVYTEKQITGACGIAIGDNLFTASKNRCEKTLRRALPYVESVRLERDIAGVLTVAVTDAEEYAAVLRKGAYYVIAPDGRVLARREKAPKGLVLITAGEEKPEIGEIIEFPEEKTTEQLQKLLELTEKNGLHLNAIDLSDELAITVKVENRFLVNFGTANYLENKIKHLASMVQTIDPKKTGTINLSMWTSSKTEGTYVEGEIE